MIDLHCHTTASDGTLEPAEVVRRAAAAGVRVLAISDHDTVAGVAKAQAEAAWCGVRIVPSVEISARLEDQEIHLLGHFVNPAEPGLLEGLAEFRERRLGRAKRMLERLRAAGIALDEEELFAQGADADSIGRPHFARLLVAKGHAADLQDAFDRWLVKGRPGWVERELPSASEALALIRAAGGVSSLAHPTVSGVEEAGIRALVEEGLAALEVRHPGQRPEARRWLRAVAAEFGLHTTAGSDFHGDAGAPGSESMDSAAFLAYEASRNP